MGINRFPIGLTLPKRGQKDSIEGCGRPEFRPVRRLLKKTHGFRGFSTKWFVRHLGGSRLWIVWTIQTGSGQQA